MKLKHGGDVEAAEVKLNVWSEIDDDRHLVSRQAPTSGQFDINAKSDEQSCLHVFKSHEKSPLVLSLAILCKQKIFSSCRCIKPPSFTFSNQFSKSSHYVTRSSFSEHNCPEFHSETALLPQAISKSELSDFSFAATQPHLVLSQQALASVTDSFVQSH